MSNQTSIRSRRKKSDTGANSSEKSTSQENLRLVTFSKELIPIEEGAQFYSLDSLQVPADRPYVWSMTVSSLDAITSFQEKGAEGAKEISLGHIKGSGSLADYRLLNIGWMMADAVMGTGSILRNEPAVKWVPQFPDLLEYRAKVLKKTKYPINVILTAGDVDLAHPIFKDKELRVVVLTTKDGFSLITKKSSDIPSHVSIEQIDDDDSETSFKSAINYKKALSILRKKYGIKFLDLTAGGRTISAMAYHKLIDEFRVTLSGQLCGGLSSQGIVRPSLFPLIGNHFTQENNPHVSYRKIGVYGEYHIFIRGGLQYRHEEATASKASSAKRKRNGNGEKDGTTVKKSKIS